MNGAVTRLVRQTNIRLRWTCFSVSDDDWTKSDAGKKEMGKSANVFYFFSHCERLLIFFF